MTASKNYNQQDKANSYQGPMRKWQNHRAVLISGAYETRKDRKIGYETITLSEIFDQQPLALQKLLAQAIIPSIYAESDAREHKKQKEDGWFVAIVGDIDKGNHPANKIDELLVQFFGESASLIYSTSSASPENRKWRFILPLELSLGFKDRHSLMDALYAFMEANGVTMDWALLRPGQLCYLPNVSPERRVGGLPTGKPLFYETYTRDGVGVTLTSGKAPEWIEKRRLEREAANALKESMRSAARAASRISKPSIIEQFNRANPLADILTACDYTQSPYRDDDWQSPHQKSGSYATRIYQEENGKEYWISLSGSDAEAGIGAKSASGVQYGDSFDIFRHFKYKGDIKAALQSLPPPLPDANRYRLISANDLAFLPPIKWRVKGILPAEGLVAIYGQPGCGKSFMVLDLLACVGRGIAWFGHKTTKCPVTFVALEGEVGVSQRIRAYQNYHGQLPITVRFMTQQFNFLTPQDVADLAAAIRACGGDNGIICIDTLNRASSGSDENDSKDMGRIIEAAKNLQELVGGLIILIHHSGKNSDRGLRGHSSLLAALDTAIEVVKNDKQRSWKLTKSKDSRDDLAGAFHLEVVNLGEDDDGETISSCVVVAEEGVAPILKPLKPSVQNAMRAYISAANTQGLWLKNSFRGLHSDAWRDEYNRTSTNSNKESNRKALQRSRDELVKLGLLTVCNDINFLNVPEVASLQPPLACDSEAFAGLKSGTFETIAGHVLDMSRTNPGTDRTSL